MERIAIQPKEPIDLDDFRVLAPVLRQGTTGCSSVTLDRDGRVVFESDCTRDQLLQSLISYSLGSDPIFEPQKLFVAFNGKDTSPM